MRITLETPNPRALFDVLSQAARRAVEVAEREPGDTTLADAYETAARSVTTLAEQVEAQIHLGEACEYDYLYTFEGPAGKKSVARERALELLLKNFVCLNGAEAVLMRLEGEARMKLPAYMLTDRAILTVEAKRRAKG